MVKFSPYPLPPSFSHISFLPPIILSINLFFYLFNLFFLKRRLQRSLRNVAHDHPAKILHERRRHPRVPRHQTPSWLPRFFSGYLFSFFFFLFFFLFFSSTFLHHASPLILNFFPGLVDGRILYDSMAHRIHPIGTY